MKFNGWVLIAGVVGVGISDEGLEQLESIMKFNGWVLISVRMVNLKDK